jgi:uncharacterized protein (TIGR00290 family)
MPMANTPQRTLMSWSSGKDSAWALHLLRQDPGIELAALFTTFNGAADRVAMHAVRRELVEAQAQRMELPLWSLDLPWPCSNAVYEDLMRGVCRRAREAGITAVAFGDLFLQDIRDYRERQLVGTGLTPLFPVWRIPTSELAGEMLRTGLKAKVTCIDLAKLDASYAGREFDGEFLSSLPAGIDPCGENGEFHTFAYDAPSFSSAISVEVGERLERDGFAFADVLPS